MSTTSPTGGALVVLVHVGEHRQAEPLLDLGEDGERLVQPDAAGAGDRGAVGLVEGGLVDEAQAEPVGDLLEGGGHFQRVIAALHGAGPGDDAERQMVAEADGASLDDGGMLFGIGHEPSLAFLAQKAKWRCDLPTVNVQCPAIFGCDGLISCIGNRNGDLLFGMPATLKFNQSAEESLSFDPR